MEDTPLQYTSSSKVLVTNYERQILSNADDSGITLLSTRLEEEFSGGLTGHGVALHIRVTRQDKSDTFTGMERFTGTLDGRRGSFALTAEGVTTQQGLVHGTWKVVADSATDELKGLRGHGIFTAAFSDANKQPMAIDNFTYWFERD